MQTPRSKWFKDAELECKCGERKGFHCQTPEFSGAFLSILDRIREDDAWSKPLIVTSALRCESHNYRVGGSKNSYHLQGLAIDLKIKPLEVLPFLDIARRYRLITGIGIGKGFVHLDIAPGKRRFWTY